MKRAASVVKHRRFSRESSVHARGVTTLRETCWNAVVMKGDTAEQVRKIKAQPGKDIVKYGTGVLDRVLFGAGLIDVLCLVVYPFLLGHGTHLFERVELTSHRHLSDVKRFESGAVILEYTPKT